MGRTRFAGQKLSGLADALQPIAEQGGRDVPYFVGTDESQWKTLMDNMHQGIRQGIIGPSNIADMLRVSDEEAQRFFKFSKERNNRHSRHVEYGVPHAYSSENVYRHLLTESGLPTTLNNLNDDRATDLKMSIDGHNYYVDVQNRTPRIGDVHTLGFVKGMHGRDEGLGVDTYKKAPKTAKLFEILQRIDRDAYKAPYMDKLGASRNRAHKESYIQDYLIGGRYNPGDVGNVMNDPSKGGYDFVSPRQVDLIDLERLRGELLNMSKSDLIAAEVRPIIKAQDKLKFEIPAQLMKALGALRNEQINPELVRLIQQ